MTLLADLLNEDGVARDVRQVSELEMESSELGKDRRPIRGPPPVSASTTATGTKQKHWTFVHLYIFRNHPVQRGLGLDNELKMVRNSQNTLVIFFIFYYIRPYSIRE